jgi:membrane AbrB-like protein
MTIIKKSVVWVALVALAWIAGKYGEQFGLPAPHVIVSVVIGLVVASTGLVRRAVPRHLHTAAQAVTGIIIGTFLNVHALSTTGGSLVPLLAVTVATLILSLAGGLVLARWTGLDQRTASLGMVAGGSAAIVGAAEDLGADARMVAFMQYLRLTLVVLTMPLLIRFAFAPGAGHFLALGAKEIEVPFSIGGWVFLLWAAPAGYVLGRLLRLPAAALLAPVILGAIVTIAGIGVNPPEVAREIAFNVIGLEVGLRLTPAALRAMGRMLPKVLLFVLLITGMCAGLAWVVTLITSISPADAYLATTPGGINAVLAIASSVHSNVALVFAVQTLRLFAMVLLAPVALKWWLGRQAATAPTRPEPRTVAPRPVAEVATAETD